MEEGIHQELKRVLITGPESAGKTELAEALADHFEGAWIPEYARGYIGQLERPYTYADLEHIALHQKMEYEEAGKGSGWIFFDTWLILTKVWFELVYGSYPDWLELTIGNANFDMILLCAPDIPWRPDPVRENSGENREKLYQLYQKEVRRLPFDWAEVKGSGEERFNCAVQLINRRMDSGLS